MATTIISRFAITFLQSLFASKLGDGNMTGSSPAAMAFKMCAFQFYLASDDVSEQLDTNN